MNTSKIIFRRLFKKGEHTTTRIISLLTGLAFGILLLSEVFYYFSFDSFYPNANRIYVIHESFKTDESSEKMESHPFVSGAIAPGLKAEVPGIEAATRLNPLGKTTYYTENLKGYQADFFLADEHHFDVLNRPILHGNPKEILSSPLRCMVSSKIAEEIGGDIIGTTIELKDFPEKRITISGIFEALPENTNKHYDVLVSMVSIGNFMWDGTDNWLGNDRYYACVKLEPGVTPEGLAPAVRKMQEKYQDIEELEQEGLTLKYTFNPITRIHSGYMKDMILILSVIAFSVLFVSVMNYILLTLSSLVKRAKTSAIHKTYGANANNLQKMILTETFLIFIISLIGAFLIILLTKPIIEAQLNHRLASALSWQVIWPILSIITGLVLLTSYLPGKFFSSIPVATAFKNYHQNKTKWKIALLCIQFAGSSFILTLLVIVSIQYNQMINADHGYRTKNVFYGSTSGMDANKIPTVLNELRALSEVETVGLGYGMPTDGAAGNNIQSPDGQKDLFNVADFYWIDENYLSILNIPVKEGNSFSTKSTATNSMLISSKGADMLKLHNNWHDGVVGKQVTISEHGTTTITGIFPDFVVHNLTNPDLRPSVFFYMNEADFQQRKRTNPLYSAKILIKVHDNTRAGVIEEITKIFNHALPQNDAMVKSLEDVQRNKYQSQQGFRNTMVAGNIIILVMTIMGLLGYTANEASARRKEVAIRKINGANLNEILHMFIMNLEYIAIPAVMVGLIGAWYAAELWMQNFAFKASLHWSIFALCSLLIFIIIALTASLHYIKTANKNPVEALRYE